MELREALLQIDTIHHHVSRVETFRGYRAASVACTGVLACAASVFQAVSISEPEANVMAYLRLWISVAAASVTIVSLELIVHCWRAPSQFASRQTWQAIEQFMPCLIAGASLTWALMKYASDSTALLPGLWAIVFSLGVCSSRRQLPPAVTAVAAYYMVSGLASIGWARDAYALTPWAMAGTFGAGQLLTAMILYWTLERRHG